MTTLPRRRLPITLWLLLPVAIVVEAWGKRLESAQHNGLLALPGGDAGLLPERGNCEVYEEGEITSQIRH